ncbi:GSU2403 family nucleotidyltransferase fold protein [Longimicrobium sp.]|uniref:GSU2403 family nucleotidyltransferase fold protein n=1 Tax=Longimicrobium sp. TaxID=2029185 RepID=UPI002E381395|nr:GSU2403 family nucleotidyltransferase fold protein [Longimicrobium sp.]HEX6042705.1 GSU2403 family nucleotidyltransferase fold protein [Longimicrobium sp.]
MDGSHYEPALRRVLWELRAYLDDVVVIGGWVPYLYRRYGGFAGWQGRTSLTVEVDVLVDRPLPPGARPSIPDILRGCGFRPSGSVGGAAVWMGDVDAGEMIEFLVPHTGTARQQGDAVPVAAQAGLRAISLPGLELMRRYRRPVRIPVATEGGETLLDVHVPWLGAYVVNKACTFCRRSAHGEGGGKRSKDLLYLRDVAAAGEEVMARLEQDLREMARDRRAAGEIGSAGNNLRLAVNGGYPGEVNEAVAALRERDATPSEAAALAEFRGRLADLLDLLPVR